MAKTVKMLKRKHSNRLWIDSDLDIWFFNDDSNRWNSLCRSWDGYWINQEIQLDKGYGPFTAIYKAG